MVFKEINDLECDTTTALGGINKKTGKSNPTKVEGFYLGFKDTPSRKAKSGIAKLYVLKTVKGNLGVWGKTDLDRKMVGVQPGFMVRITQNGSVPTPNGDMYKFKVEVDQDQSIEVNFTPQAAAAAAQEPDYSDDNQGELFNDYEESESDVDAEERAIDEPILERPAPPSRASTPVNANRARVEQLLGSRGKKSA